MHPPDAVFRKWHAAKLTVRKRTAKRRLTTLDTRAQSYPISRAKEVGLGERVQNQAAWPAVDFNRKCETLLTLIEKRILDRG